MSVRARCIPARNVRDVWWVSVGCTPSHPQPEGAAGGVLCVPWRTPPRGRTPPVIDGQRNTRGALAARPARSCRHGAYIVRRSTNDRKIAAAEAWSGVPLQAANTAVDCLIGRSASISGIDAKQSVRRISGEPRFLPCLCFVPHVAETCSTDIGAGTRPLSQKRHKYPLGPMCPAACTAIDLCERTWRHTEAGAQLRRPLGARAARSGPAVMPGALRAGDMQLTGAASRLRDGTEPPARPDTCY